jgi:hypothetical protein
MYGGAWKTLLKAIVEKWKFNKNDSKGTSFYKNEDLRFLISIIKDKKHVYPSLKHMLFEKKK